GRAPSSTARARPSLAYRARAGAASTSRGASRKCDSSEGIATADQLLDEFAETCCEEVVYSTVPTAALCFDTLQSFAYAFRVTLRVEDQSVVALGIRASVAEACQELRRYVSDPGSYSADRLPEPPESEREEQADEDRAPRGEGEGAGQRGRRRQAWADAARRAQRAGGRQARRPRGQRPHG
ncbi:unnamed protein product, partial [Prorocentrum cordatum]